MHGSMWVVMMTAAVAFTGQPPNKFCGVLAPEISKMAGDPLTPPRPMDPRDTHGCSAPTKDHFVVNLSDMGNVTAASRRADLQRLGPTQDEPTLGPGAFSVLNDKRTVADVYGVKNGKLYYLNVSGGAYVGGTSTIDAPRMERIRQGFKSILAGL